MSKTPLTKCLKGLEGIPGLAGLSLDRGVIKEVNQRLGGPKGCAHLVELLTDAIRLISMIMIGNSLNYWSDLKQNLTEEEIVAGRGANGFATPASSLRIRSDGEAPAPLAGRRRERPPGRLGGPGDGSETLIPFAAGFELVRQGLKELTLVGPISDVLFDLLIGAGCASRVVAAWVGNVMMGSGYNFRRAVEEGVPRAPGGGGPLEPHPPDGPQGRGSGPPVPAHPHGWELDRRGAPAPSADLVPFHWTPLLAVEALRPDVAVLHVQRADASGNAHVWGNLGVTAEAAFAARRVILTAEEVAPEVIASDPNRTLVPGFLVSAVAEARWELPVPLPGLRQPRPRLLPDHAASRNREGFCDWLGCRVLGVPDHGAGWTSSGGKGGSRG